MSRMTKTTKSARKSSAATRVEGLENRLLFATFTVTSAADSGPGTLRQAITDANAAPTADVIDFNIGVGPQTIAILSALPALSDTAGVTIDGTTANGFAVGTPSITIDGTGAGGGTNGLQITGGNSVVQGVVIQNFDGDQIELSGAGDNTILGNILLGVNGDGVETDAPNTRIGGPGASDRNVIASNLSQAGVRIMSNASGSVIENNRIGTNAAGTAADPNGDGIDVEDATGVSIINNLISGNVDDGISLVGSGANNAVIIGNLIGTDAAGTADLGNGGNGISIANGSDNSIGATGPNDPNTIAFNVGAGVIVTGSATGNAILGNSIFSNGGLGIDLAPVGRTANDATDSDTGPNGLQNFPVFTQVTSLAGVTTVAGTLTSTASSSFRLEFFSDTGAGSAGDAEGLDFLGALDVATNASGVASFNTTLLANLTNGQFVTATATAATGARNTSEFSDATAVGFSGPEISITGNGTSITDGDATPAAGDFTDFGSGTVGGPVVNRTFTISNNGGTTLDLSAGVTISGPGAAQFVVTDQPNGTLAAGQSTSFTIAFTAASPGNQTATVNIDNNDNDEDPFTFAIAGQGASPTPAPEIEISGNGNPIPDGNPNVSFDDLTNFGDGAIGGAGVTRTFTITNAGSQALTLGAVTITGAGVNPQQFSVVTQPATSVAAGQSTTFAVRFNPVAGGPFVATVNVPSNDANENPYDFVVRGTGVSGTGTAPTASVPPQDQQPPVVPNDSALDFIVRYTDDTGIAVGSIDSSDVVVSGPNGFATAAGFVSILSSTGTTVDVRYRVNAPGGTIDFDDNGAYTVTVITGQVADINGNTVAPGDLVGTLLIDLPTARTSLGEFGVIDGRKTKLTVEEPDGTVVTLTLTNGTGEAFRTADGRLDLDVESTGGKLTASAKGGNKRIELHDVAVTGSLANLTAKPADANGAIFATQAITAITLGSLSGATVSSPAPITTLSILGDVVNSRIFAGANLGDDGVFGGAGTAADTFAAGSINKATFGGSITNSLIAAGLDPVDNELLNGNGVILGGAASSITKLSAKRDVDAATVFAAGAYPAKVKFGKTTIIPAEDPRFDATP